MEHLKFFNSNKLVFLPVKKDQNHNIISMSFESNIQDSEFLKIAYIITLRSGYVTLKLTGPSQYFLEFFKIEEQPELSQHIQNFDVQKESFNKIKFGRKAQMPEIDFIPLQKSLISFLQSYKVCILHYSQQKKRRVEAILSALTQTSKKVRIKRKQQIGKKSSKQIIIYFFHNLKGQIERIVQHFQRYQKHSLLFSLNFFIKPEIKHYLKSSFLNEFVKKYTKEIKDIPKKNKTFLNEVQILNVTPLVMDPSYRTRDWSKSQKQGIFGLQLLVQGQDYKILKLYTYLQKFFNKISYCVTTLEKQSQEAVLKEGFNSKNENRLINLLFLENEQIIVIGPPEEFQKTKSELSKSLHTIDHHLYPYFDFSLLKKKQNTFRRFLKVRHIDFSEMVIEESSITYYTDKLNSEKIKYHTKEFLGKQCQQDYSLNFIETEKDLNIFNKFVISPLYLQFQDVQFIWQKNSAFYRCPKAIGSKIFLRIKDLYQNYLKSLCQQTGLKQIEDSLIKVIKIINVRPDKFMKWILKARDIEFGIQIKDFTCFEKETFGILMIGKGKNCGELNYFLEQQRVKLFMEKNDIFQQFIMESESSNINSIKCWKINSYALSSYEQKDEQRKNRLFFDLMSLVGGEKTVNLIITTEFLTSSFCQNLKSFLFKFTQSEQPVCKKITFLFSPYLSLNQKICFCSDLFKYFKSQLRERIIVQPKIHFQSFKEIISLKMFSLKWEYVYPNKQTQEFIASSLASFIFYFQKINLRLQGTRFGIFLPKTELIEILVHLPTEKAYLVESCSLEKVIDPSLLSKLQKIISILKQQFPYQNYAVLYSKEKTTLMTSIYVYDKLSPQTLRKYVVSTSDNTLKPAQTAPVSYKLIEMKKMDRYKYLTHPKYLETLQTLK